VVLGDLRRGVVWAGDCRGRDRLGFRTAPTVREAIEQAKDVAGPSPSITCYHWPPIFLCDVG
jgi:hypothetical protein